MLLNPPTLLGTGEYIFTSYPREKILDPQNTHEKKYWTHEIPTTRNIGPTKYPRQEILDPKIVDPRKYLGTMTQWHETHETHGL